MNREVTAGRQRREAGAIQGLVMTLTAFLPVLAIVSLAPAVPHLIQHFGHLENAKTLVPLMLTAPGLVIAFTAPFAGYAADKLGRRQLILWSTVLYGICGTAPLYLESLSMIFISRLGVGLAEAAVLTVVNTMLLDYYDVKRRRFWLMVQGIVGPFLASGTMLLSGYLTAAQWNGAFWIYIIAFPLAVFMYFFLFEPEGSVRHSDEAVIDDSVFPWSRIWVVCGTTFCMAIIYYVYTINGGSAFHSLDGASPDRIGLMLSIASLSVPLGGLLFGFSSKHLTPEKTLALVMVLMGFGMVVVGQASSVMPMGMGAMVQQVGAGMAVSAMIFWTSSLFGPAHRGRAMGAWSSAFFGGMFCSPLVVGALRNWGGDDIQVPFWVLGCAGLVIAGVLVLYSVSQHGRALRSTPQMAK